MSLTSLSDEHLDNRRLMAMTTAASLSAIWRNEVDPRNIVRTWRRAIPDAAEVVAEYQTRAAIDGQRFMDATLNDVGLTPTGPAINPAGFAGFTYPLERAPARMLEQSLEFPAYRALDGLQRGASSSRAMAGGLDSLVQIGSTAVADAGRQADGVIAATENQVTGYVRQVEAGACSRCVVLAGRRYRSNEGFERHPNCLCSHKPEIRGGDPVHIDDPYDIFNQLPPDEQDRIYTKAGAQAIRDGADMNQVVNARRGMSKTDGGSLITSEGMGKRRGRYIGNAGRTMERNNVRGARMMPEEIYKRAGGNQRLIDEQLERYGYTLPGGQQAEGVLRPQLSGWHGPSGAELRDASRRGL